MKISNSKKQLAKIISENGVWPHDAWWAAQCKSDNTVAFYGGEAPERTGNFWCGSHCNGRDISVAQVLPNWHQTILSRDEYFHLYPAQDSELVAMCADVTKENKHPEYCESVMRSIPEPGDKQTIEQLASDYKAKLEIAKRAQEEADSRRDEAEAALEKLYQAGLEIGLGIAIASDDDETETDRELVITDWRDLKVGDEVECVIPNVRKDYYTGRVGVLVEMDSSHTPLLVQFDNGQRIWCYEVKFIRRP